MSTNEVNRQFVCFFADPGASIIEGLRLTVQQGGGRFHWLTNERAEVGSSQMIDDFSAIEQLRNRLEFGEFWLLTAPEANALNWPLLQLGIDTQGFCASTKTVDQVNMLFNGVASQTRWTVFPWGSPDGLDCLAFLTTDRNLFEFVSERPFIEQADTIIDVSGPKYELAGQPLLDVCKSVILRSFTSQRSFEYFAKLIGLAASGSHAVLDAGTIENVAELYPSYGVKFERFDIVQIVDGDFGGCGPKEIAWSNDVSAVRALCDWAANHGGNMFLLPGDAPNAELSKLLNDRYEHVFIKDYLWLEKYKWYVSSGRSLSDCSDLVVGLRCPVERNAMLNEIARDVNRSSLVAAI